MKGTLAISNCRIFTGTFWLTEHAIIIKAGKISKIVASKTLPKDIPVLDLEGRVCCPGFLDTQIYGGDGVLFSEDMSIEGLARIERYLIGTGTTGFLITVPTLPFSDIEKAIDSIREYLPQSMGALLGLHVEGPYMNPMKKGAHREAWIKKPETWEIDLLIAAAKEGIVRFVTLAPEMVEADDIRRLLDAGIVVSAGHTNTVYQTYLDCFALGIEHVTHLYNAMPQLESRKPGLLAAAMDSEVMVSIVCDGQHVHYPAVRLMKKVLGERLYCITDAVTPTARLRLENDAFWNPDNILTGSALTMAKAVRNCMLHVGLPMEEAIRMATVYPAKALKMGKELGKIAAGYQANFTVLDADGGMSGVMIKGEYITGNFGHTV